MADHRSELVSNTAQAVPAMTGVWMWLTGHDINFWVGVGGLVFILLQCGYLIWKWRRDVRREEHDFPPIDE